MHGWKIVPSNWVAKLSHSRLLNKKKVFHNIKCEVFSNISHLKPHYSLFLPPFYSLPPFIKFWLMFPLSYYSHPPIIKDIQSKLELDYLFCNQNFSLWFVTFWQCLKTTNSNWQIKNCRWGWVPFFFSVLQILGWMQFRKISGVISCSSGMDDMRAMLVIKKKLGQTMVTNKHCSISSQYFPIYMSNK